jgi:hypothetical protein
MSSTRGGAELLRIQNGGCRPVEGCTAAPYALANGGSTNVYPGADFQYLAANVVVDTTGKTLFPAYATKTFRNDHGKQEARGRLHRRGARGHADAALDRIVPKP